jgi:hypothetical protein
LTPVEIDAVLAVAEEWGEVDRSHRKLAHRGSSVGRVGVAVHVRRVLAAGLVLPEPAVRDPTPKIGDAPAQENEPLTTEVKASATPCASPPPSWALMERVLGPVDIVAQAGQPVAFGRPRSLELIVWLAQVGGDATRAGARSALWGLDISGIPSSTVAPSLHAPCQGPPVLQLGQVAESRSP